MKKEYFYLNIRSMAEQIQANLEAVLEMSAAKDLRYRPSACSILANNFGVLEARMLDFYGPDEAREVGTAYLATRVALERFGSGKALTKSQAKEIEAAAELMQRISKSHKSKLDA